MINRKECLEFFQARLDLCNIRKWLPDTYALLKNLNELRTFLCLKVYQY